jgi:hypothetical protein
MTDPGKGEVHLKDAPPPASPFIPAMKASIESPLSLVPLQDPSSGHASIADNTPPLSPKQSLLNPNNYVIITQNNCIAEGGTTSGHCTGSGELLICITHKRTHLENKP